MPCCNHRIHERNLGGQCEYVLRAAAGDRVVVEQRDEAAQLGGTEGEAVQRGVLDLAQQLVDDPVGERARVVVDLAGAFEESRQGGVGGERQGVVERQAQLVGEVREAGALLGREVLDGVAFGGGGRGLRLRRLGGRHGRPGQAVAASGSSTPAQVVCSGCVNRIQWRPQICMN